MFDVFAFLFKSFVDTRKEIQGFTSEQTWLRSLLQQVTPITGGCSRGPFGSMAIWVHPTGVLSNVSSLEKKSRQLSGYWSVNRCQKNECYPKICCNKICCNKICCKKICDRANVILKLSNKLFYSRGREILKYDVTHNCEALGVVLNITFKLNFLRCCKY